MVKQKIYSVRQFAEALGVTPKTVYNWIKDGKLQVIKISGTIRIPHLDISQLDNQQAPPNHSLKGK